MRKLIAISALLLSSLSAKAFAQGAVEAGIYGRTSQDFPGSTPDKSMNGVAGSLGIFPLNHLGVEAAGSWSKMERDGTGFDEGITFKDRIWTGTARVVATIGENRTHLLLGAGYSRLGQRHQQIIGDQTLPGEEGSLNSLHLMGGVRLTFAGPVGLRVNGILEHPTASGTRWGKALEAGLSFRFGGHKPVVKTVQVIIAEPVVIAEPIPLPAPDVEEVPPMVVRLTTVHFAFDKATLTPIAKEKLRSAADSLNASQNMVVELIGHTDARGTASYNQKLSERRAETVRTYLVTRGVENSRIATIGMGEEAPIGDNKTAEGRAKNRRVEVNGKR